MTDQILPSFWRYPEHGAIIGRMLAGYGELEYELAICLSKALQDQELGIRVLFRTRGEEQRIQIADALLREKYRAAGLYEPYCEIVSNLGWCRQLRNKFAHCHWYDTDKEGLCFTEMEAWAKKPHSSDVPKYPITLSLLKEQEGYFRYVQDSLWYLQTEAERMNGLRIVHAWPLPKKRERPSFYADK